MAGRYDLTVKLTKGSPAPVSAATRLLKVSLVSGIVGAVGTGDGDQHAPLEPVPGPGGQGLGDADEGPREVLVVPQRDRAVEGEHGQRRVGARVGERFRVGGAGGRLGIDRRFDAERRAQQLAELARLDEPSRPIPLR